MHAGFFNAQAVLKPYILKAISRGRFISTLGRGGESETDVFFRDEFGVKSRGTVLYQGGIQVPVSAMKQDTFNAKIILPDASNAKNIHQYNAKWGVYIYIYIILPRGVDVTPPRGAPPNRTARVKGAKMRKTRG